MRFDQVDSARHVVKNRGTSYELYLKNVLNQWLNSCKLVVDMILQLHVLIIHAKDLKAEVL